MLLIVQPPKSTSTEESLIVRFFHLENISSPDSDQPPQIIWLKPFPPLHPHPHTFRKSLRWLQHVQNSSSNSDWLPDESCVSSKLLLLATKCLHALAPRCPSDLLTPPSFTEMSQPINSPPCDCLRDLGYRERCGEVFTTLTKTTFTPNL